MINNTILVGRLTRDSELKHTGNGIAVASFTVAVERSFTNQNGEKEADFINVVAWRKTAEIISNYTQKGSMIGIKGRIQTRNYTNNEGHKVYITEVVAEEVQLLSRKNEDQQPSARSQSDYTHTPENEPEGPFETYDDSVTISDDDLPF